MKDTKKQVVLSLSTEQVAMKKAWALGS